VVPISHPLPVLYVVFTTLSLVLERDGAMPQVAQGLVLTCLQSLVKTVVKTSQEPELLLLFGVGVLRSVCESFS
jgi:hypothetical protein